MRHISISIAFALSTLLFVSICSAQQTATTSQHTATSAENPSNTTKLVGGPDTVINCVGAQVGRISVFTQTLPPNVILCNSGIYEAAPYGTGAIGILNPHPIAALDVTGAANTSLYYQIGGSNVLSIGSLADFNLFLGVGAGANNVAGSGKYNTFSGYAAGFSNTTGNENTFHGAAAGYSNNTGFDNTFVGAYAGSNNTSGVTNTFYGDSAGYSNTTANQNTFTGSNAGRNTTMGGSNSFYGSGSGTMNTTGINNTFSGQGAGYNNTTGINNAFYGVNAGVQNVTGSFDVYIANQGPASGNESNTVRIGDPTYQTSAYIAGIYGSTASSGVAVYVNSVGQLGTSPSSLRFKEQVRDMGDSTNALMKLRPVTFRYKSEYDKGERTLQYGLIAEEVAKVYPELVANDNDGQPYSVRYQYITTMLLNEVQKQYHRVEAEAKVITAQEQKIDELEQRLSRLESLIPQTVAQK